MKNNNLIKNFVLSILFSFAVPFVCVACELPSLEETLGLETEFDSVEDPIFNPVEDTVFDPVGDQRIVETLLWRVDSPNTDLKRTAMVVTSGEDSINDFVLLDDQNNELLRRYNISIGPICSSPVFRPDGMVVAVMEFNQYENNWRIEFFNTESGDLISYFNDVNPNKNVFFIHGDSNKAIVHDAKSGEAIVLDCSDVEPALFPYLTKKLYGVKFLTLSVPGSLRQHFAVGVHYNEYGTCQYFPVPYSE